MFLRRALTIGILAFSFGATPALAQQSTAEIEASKKIAAENANKAFEFFEAGKYEEAISGFKKAEAAFHAPKFLLYIARAQAKLGRTAEAKATYDSILAEQLPPYAPPEFFSAQASAKKEVGELSKTAVPPIEKPGPKSSASASSTAPPTALSTSSGPVVGASSASNNGETPPSPTNNPQGPSRDKPSSNIPTGSFVSYGVGAVGLVVGAVFGGLTLAKKGDYDTVKGTQPVDNAALNQLANDGKTFSIVADVGFLVAIAGAAAGTVIWIVSPNKQGTSPSGAPTKAARGSTYLKPTVGGMFVGGSF